MLVFIHSGACGSSEVSAPPKAKRKVTVAKPDAGALGLKLPSHIDPPEVLGVLAGPGTAMPPPDVELYGLDLGISYEHQGKLFTLFGDTWPYARFICDRHTTMNDDTVATLPVPYPGDVPQLEFVTAADSHSTLADIQLFRDGVSLSLGYAKTPLAAFSDGEHAFTLFGRVDMTRCDADHHCPAATGFNCSFDAGECLPMIGDSPFVCDMNTGEGCFPGQVCMLSQSGFCVDPGSSEFDGSNRGTRAAMVQNLVIGVQHDDHPELFDAAAVWQTNRFGNPAMRTVERFTGQLHGNDYSPGHGTLLVWGRPGFYAEQGRQAQVYLMTHALPLELDDKGQLSFQPQYFAGVDPATNEPSWSGDETDAKPLALDGQVDGDPSESVKIVDQLAVSWLGAPIQKWVMLYGGDEVDGLLADRMGDRAVPWPGAIMIRFAEHPWGPWSAPRPHLVPGDPNTPGDLYGPGGVLFISTCHDLPDQTCARTDPARPYDSILADCPMPAVQMDSGHLYAPNIIDAYTMKNDAGGLDMYWNFSTWNPYAVAMARSRFAP